MAVSLKDNNWFFITYQTPRCGLSLFICIYIHVYLRTYDLRPIFTRTLESGKFAARISDGFVHTPTRVCVLRCSASVDKWHFTEIVFNCLWKCLPCKKCAFSRKRQIPNCQWYFVAKLHETFGACYVPDYRLVWLKTYTWVQCESFGRSRSTYIRMYVCMYVCMYVHLYICMYECTFLHMYVATYKNTPMRTFADLRTVVSHGKWIIPHYPHKKRYPGQGHCTLPIIFLMQDFLSRMSNPQMEEAPFHT
jgi:hypothetical protein